MLRIMVILGAVRGVNLVVDGGIGFLYEDDILVNAARLDVTFVPRLDSAKPEAVAPLIGAHVKIILVANDPNRHRLARRTVES
jgi:hypothetical protein